MVIAQMTLYDLLRFVKDHPRPLERSPSVVTLDQPFTASCSMQTAWSVDYRTTFDGQLLSNAELIAENCIA